MCRIRSLQCQHHTGTALYTAEVQLSPLVGQLSILCESCMRAAAPADFRNPVRSTLAHCSLTLHPHALVLPCASNARMSSPGLELRSSWQSAARTAPRPSGQGACHRQLGAGLLLAQVLLVSAAGHASQASQALALSGLCQWHLRWQLAYVHIW